MYPSEFDLVVTDLQKLVGSFVDGAWVPRPDLLILELGSGSKMLHVEVYPVPRIHTLNRRPKNPLKPYSFQGLLRARFRGKITAIRQVDNDRVVEIETDTATLHCRLFGRGGGIWLKDRDGAVLAGIDGPSDSLPARESLSVSNKPPRFAAGPMGASEAAREFFEPAVREYYRHRQVSHTRQHLRKREKKQSRLQRNLMSDLEKAQGAEELRDRADLLGAYLHQVKKGMEEIQLPSFEDPEVLITIPLDPSRTAVDNHQRLYKKAKKLDASLGPLEERLLACMEELEELEHAIGTLNEVDHRDLRKIRKRWKVPPLETVKRPVASTPKGWHEWKGPKGQRIFVGKNSLGNHSLTFRKAKGRDLWMHLRERPGSHVIIPLKRGQNVPLELLLVGAELVLRAAAITSGTHDVQYTKVSNLKAIKGGAPGAVIVTQEKVLHVTRQSDLLAAWEKID